MISSATSWTTLIVAVTALFTAVVNADGVTFTIYNSDDEAFLNTQLRVNAACTKTDNVYTKGLELTIAEDINIISAGYIPGWNITYTRADVNPPVKQGFHTITSRVQTIKWEMKDGAMPASTYIDLPMRMFLPTVEDQTKNQTLFFPAKQLCNNGQSDDWNQIPLSDSYNAALRHDAPSITINVNDPDSPWLENRNEDGKTAASKTSGASSVKSGAAGLMFAAITAAYCLL